MRDLATLTAADFTALRGDRLRIVPGSGAPFEAELVDVSEIPREPGGRAPFSLVFQAAHATSLPQGIHRVEHEQLGAIEIFLVPIGPGRYEAVFT